MSYRLFGEIAPFGKFLLVVLFDEHSGDEPEHRGVVREDADDVGPTLVLRPES